VLNFNSTSKVVRFVGLPLSTIFASNIGGFTHSTPSCTCKPGASTRGPILSNWSL
jgi:hypothetical protein